VSRYAREAGRWGVRGEGAVEGTEYPQLQDVPQNSILPYNCPPCTASSCFRRSKSGMALATLLQNAGVW